MVQAKQLLTDAKKAKEKEMEEKLELLKQQQVHKEDDIVEVVSHNRRGRRGPTVKDEPANITIKRPNQIDLAKELEYFNKQQISSNLFI